jgi:hypothetical protein
VSSHGFSDADSPFTLLYEHMIVHGWQAVTIRSNAGK